jgi:transcriptional regulator
MRVFFLGMALSLGLAVAAQASDGPASCEVLNAARRDGDSVEDVARRFATTRARVAACARVAQSQAKAAARQQHVVEARAARSSAR